MNEPIPPDPLRLPQVTVYELREMSLTDYADAVTMLRTNFPDGLPVWSVIEETGWDVVTTQVPNTAGKLEFAVMGCKSDALYAVVRNVEVDVRALASLDMSAIEQVVATITKAAVTTFFAAAEAKYADQSMMLSAALPTKMEPS